MFLFDIVYQFFFTCHMAVSQECMISGNMDMNFMLYNCFGHGQAKLWAMRNPLKMGP